MLLQGWSYIHCAVLYSTTKVLESREARKRMSLKDKIPYSEIEESLDDDAESVLVEDDVSVYGYDSPEVQAKHIELQYGVSIEQSGILLLDSCVTAVLRQGCGSQTLFSWAKCSLNDCGDWISLTWCV